MNNNNNWRTIDIVYVGLFAVLITACSWISIPTTIPFTMQTFGVSCTLGILNGKRGTFTILIYLLLGAIGIPVFAKFAGGLGALFDVTGGYKIGFLIAGIIYWLITRRFGDGPKVMAAAMTTGLIACYLFGTAWFMYAYAGTVGPVGLWTALGWCVFPFIIPDAVKIGLAIFLTERLKKCVKI